MKGGDVAKAAVTQKCKAEKQLTVLSSADERNIIIISHTKSRDKNKKSLTSTLSARSKVMSPTYIAFIFYQIHCDIAGYLLLSLIATKFDSKGCLWTYQ